MEISDIRRENLRALMHQRFHGKQVALAEAIGRSPNYISRCLSASKAPGSAKNIGEELARDIESRLGLDRYQMDQPGAFLSPATTEAQEAGSSEGGQRHESLHSNVAPTLQPHREAKEYPLISWVAAGNWAESCVVPHRSAADEWLESSVNVGLHGYWLEVKGRSMVDPSGQSTASFPPGMRILVQPEGFDVISGKFYIARLRAPGGSWETTFKQYVRDAGVGYLQPLNTDFDTLRIDENVEIIGRVVDARPPRSVF